MGIAENTSEVGPGDETGKAVDVQESLEFGHPRIVTSSPRQRKSDFVGKSREKSALTTESYPHDFTKSRKTKKPLLIAQERPVKVCGVLLTSIIRGRS